MILIQTPTKKLQYYHFSQEAVGSCSNNTSAKKLHFGLGERKSLILDGNVHSFLGESASLDNEDPPELNSAVSKLFYNFTNKPNFLNLPEEEL